MRQILGLSARRFIVFLFDLCAIGIAFYGSFLLRFDFKVPAPEYQLLLKTLPWIYLIQTPVFIGFGLYRGLWSFASIRDLFLIVRAVLLASILTIAGIAFHSHSLIGWPRSVFVLDGVLLVLFCGGGRFSYRLGRELLMTSFQNRKRILVIGAGQSANLIAREFSNRPELAAKVVGFLDDSPAKKGLSLHGAPVLGQLTTLGRWLDQLTPDEIIIAIPSLPGAKVKEIVTEARKRSVPCRVCPPIRDLLLGKIELSQLRPVRVEDLLRREVVRVDEEAISSQIKGRRILVTGAGGSIGSELCRQILKYEPRCLVLYERSEFNLYRFEQELKQQGLAATNTELVFVIGDILNQTKLSATFEKYHPEIVLHAAAYKHVPLMEENIFEALNNNVVGSYRLVTTAQAHGVSTFVLVSTDKAVRPSSVMGASKRMAELVTQAASRKGSMKTLAVRFGNVLDSEGSVLPLFRDQIARGGPLTVTDPRVTRYFMTIPEAAILVLQASVLGCGGEVFLLDMGEPVLIRELAEELIKLSGYRPYEDIEIRFTGLRKGEKLYEELLFDMSCAKSTSHPKIMVSTDEHNTTLPTDWNSTLEHFITQPTLEDTDLLEWIHAWVKEYRPPNQHQNEKKELSLDETDPATGTRYIH